MRLLSPPHLHKTTKEEIKAYFLNTFSFFESIFSVLKPEAFYKKSEPTRHPMIFYFGHTAVFYINKLIIADLIKERINPEFESIFAVGVDEMEWDNLDENAYKWPSIEEVQEYREKVKKRVIEFIDATPLTLPITWESPYWIVLMGCEHERIHIETSSVLHRQMPLEFIHPKERFCPNSGDAKAFAKNELVLIPATTVRLGKDKEHFYYGWDNEYGTQTHKLKSFLVSKFLVSNGEFLEFVEDSGYEKEEFWSEEGKAFLKRSGATHPHFWRKTPQGWLYRAYDREIPLPLDFPADVNALEAQAFCKWKSKQEGTTYKLISEAEYRAIYEFASLGEIVSDKEQNVNFAYGFSSTSVDKFHTNGIYDVCGNAWCWSRTPIDAFSGFTYHYAYDDFSTPTFDGKHDIIVGASWASSGNLIMKHSRYAFRRHFFQHASFRYVVSQNEDIAFSAYIEKEPQVVAALKADYLEEKELDFVKYALKYAKKTTKALDMGCKTGRSTFEMAKMFQKVEGIDATARLLKVAAALKNDGFVRYLDNNEEKILHFNTSEVKEKVQFWQGDENNLKAQFNGYDFILYRENNTNFLNIVAKITDKNAIIVCSDKTIRDIPNFYRIAPGIFQKREDSMV